MTPNPAAAPDDQRGRSPPERFISQPPPDGIARSALTAAAATPPVRLAHPTRKHRPARSQPLASDLKPELIESTEGSRISASKASAYGSVSHVEVFQMDPGGTSILERPRPLSRQRRAEPDTTTYTANCEEPL
jgi:hypothetical protein